MVTLLIIIDKQQAWDDLHRLTTDENSDIGSRASLTLGSIFSELPDKKQAFRILEISTQI